ncbi:MAG: signal peptidase II [Clostridia bacterium]|nr:signal peptidase II [Clostridia bacterium]
MKKKDIIFYVIIGAVIALSIVADQVTKTFFANLLGANGEIRVLGDFVKFDYVKNYGASFGMFSGNNLLFFIMTVVGIPVFLLLIYISRKEKLIGCIGLALMVGGAIGNAIDRFMYSGEGEFFSGYVRDFVSVKYFAVFNVADACMCVGVALYILCLLFFNSDSLYKTSKNKKAENNIDGVNDPSISDSFEKANSCDNIEVVRISDAPENEYKADAVENHENEDKADGVENSEKVNNLATVDIQVNTGKATSKDGQGGVVSLADEALENDGEDTVAGVKEADVDSLKGEYGGSVSGDNVEKRD